MHSSDLQSFWVQHYARFVRFKKSPATVTDSLFYLYNKHTRKWWEPSNETVREEGFKNRYQRPTITIISPQPVWHCRLTNFCSAWTLLRDWNQYTPNRWHSRCCDDRVSTVFSSSSIDSWCFVRLMDSHYLARWMNGERNTAIEQTFDLLLFGFVVFFSLYN